MGNNSITWEGIGNPNPTPRQIAQVEREAYQKRHLHGMHDAYGERTDRRCGDCAHCTRKRLGTRTVYKCSRAGLGGGSDTDWRRGWAACGLYAKAGPTNALIARGAGEYSKSNKEPFLATATE